MNSVQLSRTLIRSVRGSFPNLNEYPLSQVVTFKYFAGQFEMFEGRLKEADEELGDSFARCSKNNPKNKRYKEKQKEINEKIN